MPPFIFPPQLPSLTFQPIRYRPNGIGYWSGHIPFACDLVATLRPETLVELGTHMGESYFAFCQAIVESSVECRAFAVDTWRGDEHTGAYDDVVFKEVQEHNQEQYGHFSTLLRMSFDQAAQRFGTESIDLLHIDGAHTYEAVSHDFAQWWPKVRHGGVVLLHDSFERQESFGVWRLLEEVRSAGIPAGDFFHSHGLGVLMKPPIVGDENVAAAFVKASDGSMRDIRSYYEVCADHLHCQYLLDKQSRPAEWEVTSQLFWRLEGQSFTEQQSVRIAHVVGLRPSTAVLNLPPSSEPYAEFRLALTLVPALLTLFEIRVDDLSGHAIWTQSSEDGVLFGPDPHESIMDFEWPEALIHGGQVCLVMAGVEPLAAAKLASELARKPERFGHLPR